MIWKPLDYITFFKCTLQATLFSVVFFGRVQPSEKHELERNSFKRTQPTYITHSGMTTITMAPTSRLESSVWFHKHIQITDLS